MHKITFKCLLIIFVSMTSLYAFNESPWSEYVGCYDTIKINGKGVVPGLNHQTLIEEDIHPAFVNTDGSDFRYLKTMIIIRRDETDFWFGNSLSPLIDANGVTINLLENGLEFRFDGILSLRDGGGNSQLNIHSRISRNNLGNVVIEDLARPYIYELVNATCIK